MVAWRRAAPASRTMSGGYTIATAGLVWRPSARSSQRARGGGETTTGTRYYLMSAAPTPERFHRAVCSHWAIENTLHWVLDMTMNEDSQRNRTGHGPENLAPMRRPALNVARREPGKNAMRGKLERAGRDDNFTLDLIRTAVNQA